MKVKYQLDLLPAWLPNDSDALSEIRGSIPGLRLLLLSLSQKDAKTVAIFYTNAVAEWIRLPTKWPN